MTYLIALSAVLQLLDIATTLYFLRHGHKEGNGFMARLMARIGVVPALLLTKGFLIALVWYFAAGIPPVGWAIIIAIQVAVIVWNVLVIKGWDIKLKELLFKEIV